MKLTVTKKRRNRIRGQKPFSGWPHSVRELIGDCRLDTPAAAPGIKPCSIGVADPAVEPRPVVRRPRFRSTRRIVLLVFPSLVLPGVVQAQECYDPADQPNRPKSVYYGDLHVHTNYSMDSYAMGNFNGPDEAYRFARGEPVHIAPVEVQTDAGPVTIERPLQLARPLDFAAVTDHAEYLAETRLCTTPDTPFYDSAVCEDFRGGSAGSIINLSVCQDYPAFCQPADQVIWRDMITTANTHYDPCTFTSFVGYEWTGGPSIHRNVIYRNDSVPDLPISKKEEPDASQLRRALYDNCQGSAERPDCEVLLIPHNSNNSNGVMFDIDEGEAFETFAFRESMEPLLEVMQHKGSSECSPASSPDDPYCDFEIISQGSGSKGSNRGYFREALKKGLDREAQHPSGDNPLRLGVISSTDTHNGTPGATNEADFLGHLGMRDASARDDGGALVATGALRPGRVEFNPGGLAGIWALENTRDALYDALKRREVFATSGPRIKVKLHARWTDSGAGGGAAQCHAMARDVAATGVAMGTVLPAAESPLVPEIAVVALSDPDGTPFQQIQIVKIWIAADGRPQEQVVASWYDANNARHVAFLDDLELGQIDNGSGLDLNTCEQEPGYGKPSYCLVWADEAYDSASPVAYYARVLENPSCRHSAYVCAELSDTYSCDGGFQGDDPFLSACCDPTYYRGIQERAWTSPIFVQKAVDSP